MCLLDRCVCVCVSRIGCREGKGTGDAPAAAAAPKPVPAPQRVVMCSSCKAEPAKRRCAASKWEAVCEACAVRMEAALAAASAAPAATGGGIVYGLCGVPFTHVGFSPHAHRFPLPHVIRPVSDSPLSRLSPSLPYRRSRIPASAVVL